MSVPAANVRRAAGLRATAFAVALGCALAGTGVPARAALSEAQRLVLSRYLEALHERRFAAAFGLLSRDERSYFGTPANFASAFVADGLVITSYRILGSTVDAGKGLVTLVSERVEYLDHARGRRRVLQATVAYGIARNAGHPAVKDPYHPWRALAPTQLATTVDSLRVSVRKVSFFTGRVEVVASFANLGERPVTILPYGRSVMRDDAGRAYVPFVSKLAGLTDVTLFEGLRLPGNAQYTGSMTFLTPSRFKPKTLTLVFAPGLVDGSDAPFEVVLPPLSIAP